MNILDSKLYRGLAVCTDFLFLDLLWLVCCLPVVTIPSSTAAMFGMVREWTHERGPGIFETFFSLFKENWRQSSGIGALWVLLGTLLAVDVFVLRGMDSPVREIVYVPTFVIALLYAFGSVYVFPVMVNYDARWIGILRNAVLFSIGGVLNTLGCLLVIGLAIVAFVISPITLVFSGSVGAYLIYRLCNRTFSKAEPLKTDGKKDNYQ